MQHFFRTVEREMCDIWIQQVLWNLLRGKLVRAFDVAQPGARVLVCGNLVRVCCCTASWCARVVARHPGARVGASSSRTSWWHRRRYRWAPWWLSSSSPPPPPGCPQNEYCNNQIKKIINLYKKISKCLNKYWCSYCVVLLNFFIFCRGLFCAKKNIFRSRSFD